eukprot:GFUD01043427.1.p1 GENE.GFUD01043427.1~~GFUD01043427.1.p1  ORF type:complete len:291 (-),score=76.20 GFUD01043427.1:96-968(-)
MESETVNYPFIRMERAGPYWKVIFSVVDPNTKEVLATWVETWVGGNKEDCRDNAGQDEDPTNHAKESRMSDPNDTVANRANTTRDQGVTEEEGLDPCSVYVGNLDHSVTSLDLASHFYQAGEVSRLTVLRNKKTGHHMGAAYILFKDQAGMERALSLNGSFLEGKAMRVRKKRKDKICDNNRNHLVGNQFLKVLNGKRKKDLTGEKEVSGKYDPHSVYVGNMDFQVTSDDLVEHFKTAGEIVRVTILKSKADAYVQFRDHWSVEGALCMQGSRLWGRKLIVRRKKMTKVK